MSVGYLKTATRGYADDGFFLHVCCLKLNHKALWFRSCSYLVLTCVLGNQITSGRPWVHVFTTAITISPHSLVSTWADLTSLLEMQINTYIFFACEHQMCCCFQPAANKQTHIFDQGKKKLNGWLLTSLQESANFTKFIHFFLRQ